MDHWIFFSTKARCRGQEKSEQKINKYTNTAANDGVQQRLTQTTFASHYGERLARFRQNHDQCLHKCIEESALLPVFPWKTGARRRRLRYQSCATLHRRRCSCHATKLRKLRQRLPVCHSFTPPDVTRSKSAGAQAFANFFFGECAETCCPAINVNHGHNCARSTEASSQSQCSTNGNTLTA